MELFYNINDSGFDSNGLEELKAKLIEYNTYNGIKPSIEIVGDVIKVSIDTQLIEAVEKEFNSIAKLLNAQKWADGKRALKSFIQKYPHYSEAHRNLAQVKMLIDNDIDGAINSNIEALRCNPHNTAALLLMGNIYCNYRKDFKTAKTFYEKALESEPDNPYAISNIAGLHLMEGDIEKAEDLFIKANSIAPQINAFYGLSACYMTKEKYQQAFDIALEGSLKFRVSIENPDILDKLHANLFEAAKRVVENTNYLNVMLGIKESIEKEEYQAIKIESDESLNVCAQMQYGPTHNRDYHLVKYNPSRPYMEHLAVHEMMHLYMNLEASKANNNKIIVATKENKLAFRAKYKAWTERISKQIGQEKALQMTDHLQDGLMLQVMNCPLDMFVEQRIFDNYKAMRPLQLLSLMQQQMDNIQSVQQSTKSKMFPSSIIDASRIMNIVTAMHFEDLYGIRLYQNFNPTKADIHIAQDLYQEYQAYSDYKPGEEYDLIDYFADSFELTDYITLNNESSLSEHKKIDDFLNFMPVEPRLSPDQQEQQNKFYEQNQDGQDSVKTTMMSMYMYGALEYFDDKPLSEIIKIGMEIAVAGMDGIDPSKKEGYHVLSMPGKDFGGYQFLAYYYVSWALAMPEMLSSLGLPFDAAWESAKQLWETKKGKKENE